MFDTHPLALSTYLGDEKHTKKELKIMHESFNENYLGSFNTLKEAIDSVIKNPDPDYTLEEQFRDDYLDLWDDNLTIHLFRKH